MKYLRLILFPFAILYGLIGAVRNLFYQIGIFKSTSFEMPIICVGNLSTGGTGKTPHIEYLIRMLSNNYNTATLSRGYKRKTEGFIIANKNHTAADIGDEPLQFFKKFPNIHVTVDRKRANGVAQIKQNTNTELVLLDDAFQHRAIKAGFYILLSDYNHLFTSDFILPAGNLRESRFGANRADLVIVTKCPNHIDLQQKEKIKKRIAQYTKADVCFSSIHYTNPISLSSKESIALNKDTHYLLVSGIANPKPLYNYLNKKSISYTKITFPDHHHFDEQDIHKIMLAFDKIDSKNKQILTTEKDAMRLYDHSNTWIESNPISYIPIQICMNEKDEETFRSKIHTFIKQKTKYKV